MTPTRVVISGFQTGLEKDKPDFLISNESFIRLMNAFIWRNRLRKKPGVQKLGRLQREATLSGINLDGSGNLAATSLITALSLEASASLSPGTVSFSDGTNTYTEPATPDGTLAGSPGGSGTIDYATTEITITGGAASQPLTGTVDYFPNLPVMGIEDFDNDNKTASSQVNRQETVFFDTTYAYEFSSGSFIDASFYRTTNAPVIWHGADYQQFWSTNYQDAMFVTNNVPGMHGAVPATVTPGVTTAFTTTDDDLETGDIVFFNEFTGTAASTINLQTATVTRVGVGSYTVPINTSAGSLANGIVQYLTKTATPTASTDGIRWFDGLDTSAPFSTGFVNFAPPLDNLASSSTTYLVGARIIIPFGSRLLALGTFESTSAILGGTAATYYPNRIRFCQVLGTCFYANNPSGGTASSDAWISNIQGFGGFIDLDSSERIVTAGVTQDTLVIGQETQQKKLQVTQSDTLPFTVQTINSEYGSESTHSTIVFDQGILTASDYGFIMTSTFNAQRFDNKIPDQIYELKQTDNGNERVTAIRDFQNQVVYFTYPQDITNNSYPNRTVLYNYNENNFAVFKESYTTYGIFRRVDGVPWEEIDFVTWDEWQIPWELNVWSAEFPSVAAGNQQGYVMLKNFQSSNDPSLYISAVSGNNVTSPNHNLEIGDFVGFKDLSDNAIKYIRQVSSVTSTDVVVFDGDLASDAPVAGLTEMVIMDNFDILTKRFPMAWQDGRKTRLGTSRYYLEKTNNGEFVVDILINQLDESDNNPSFGSLISSNVIRTRPDDDLGFTGQAAESQRLWHRIPTSAVGDTIQLRFQMNETQMTSIPIATSMWFLYAFILDFYPSRILI